MKAISRPTKMSANEIATVKKARKGDVKAKEEVLKLAEPFVFYNCLKFTGQDNREDAEDLAQETLVKVHTRLNSLDKNERYLSWVLSITLNTCKDFYRKKKDYELFSDEDDQSAQEVYEQIPDEDLQSQKIPEKKVDNDETRQMIHDIVNELPDEQRIAVTLMFYDCMTSREIAEQLKVNENTVKYRLSAGKKRIKKRIEELKAEGIKLYNLAPATFLSYLSYFLQNEAEETAHVVFAALPVASILAIAGETGTTAGMIAGATSSAAASVGAASMAAGTAAGAATGGGILTGLGAFLATVGGKVAIGVAITAVVTWSALTVSGINNTAQQDESSATLSCETSIASSENSSLANEEGSFEKSSETNVENSSLSSKTTSDDPELSSNEKSSVPDDSSIESSSGNSLSESTFESSESLEESSVVYTYQWLSGASQTYILKSRKTMTFIVDGPYDKVSSIMIDGIALASGYYLVSEGTSIILKPSVLETLKAGDHSMDVIFDTGETVSVVFTIVEATAESSESTESSQVEESSSQEESSESSVMQESSSESSSESSLEESSVEENSHIHTYEETGKTYEEGDRNGHIVITTYTCLECGDTYTEETVASHLCDYWVEYNEVNSNLHHSAPPTGAEGESDPSIYYHYARCSTCNYTFQEEHDWCILWYTYREPATCTEGGWSGRQYWCSDCRYVWNYHISDTPALGHDYQETERTQNENGTVTITYVCTRCSDSYTETKANDSSGSNEVNTFRLSADLLFIVPERFRLAA